MTLENAIMNGVIALAVAAAVIALASAAAEPKRQRGMAIFLAVGASVYSNGGFGLLEPMFQVMVACCAYQGLRSYRWIGFGWLLHTGWDIVHHHAGHPLEAEVAASSFMCAVADPVLALWCFLGAPRWPGRRERASSHPQAR